MKPVISTKNAQGILPIVVHTRDYQHANPLPETESHGHHGTEVYLHCMHKTAYCLDTTDEGKPDLHVNVCRAHDEY